MMYKNNNLVIHCKLYVNSQNLLKFYCKITCDIKLLTVFHCIWSGYLQLTRLTGFYYTVAFLKFFPENCNNNYKHFVFILQCYFPEGKKKKMPNRSLVNCLTS